MEIPEALDHPTWLSWMRFKEEFNKPYKTIKGIQTAMNQLAELSTHQQKACINHSIANEYQGFFPEKFTGVNNANRNNKKSQTETTAERINREATEAINMVIGQR